MPPSPEIRSHLPPPHQAMSHQDSAGSTAAASATDPRSTSTPSAAISSDSPSAFDAAANKTRRSHRKSRNGCAECKRRHIRCDEHRPLCSNCVSADRACVFPRAPATATPAPTPNAGVSKSATSTTNGSRRRHHVAADAAATPPHHLHSPCAPANTPSPRPGMPWEEMSGPLPRPNPSTASYTFRRSNYVYYPATTSSIDTTAAAAPPTPHAGLDPDLSASASIYTPFHLQLFHHINTVMLPDPGVNTSNHLKQFVDIAMRHAVDAPYLINELLAVAAMHMATQKEHQLFQQQQQQQQQQNQNQNPDGLGGSSSSSNTPASTSAPSHAVLPPLLPPHGSPSSTSSPASLPSITTPSSSSFPTNPFITNLRHQATELQTRAVANFTRLTAHLPPDDTASCIPRFLFSSTLSMHSLADSLAELRAANSDFHGFIDRFVDCFNLYRGIRAVIYPTWQFLSDSELRPLLEVTREANLGIVERGHECAPLHDLLRHSDLAPASLEACRVAVDKLQWAFDLHNNLAPGSGQHAVSAFSVIVSAEYVDVLRKHRPEALIILSYFAVLLHRCRHFWIFQNSGACMIRAIANHIGSYWRDAMAWPLQVVETEDC
ncbi:hypothetical protein MY3296_003343 [Beauveria thailandica]